MISLGQKNKKNKRKDRDSLACASHKNYTATSPMQRKKHKFNLHLIKREIRNYCFIRGVVFFHFVSSFGSTYIFVLIVVARNFLFPMFYFVAVFHLDGSATSWQLMHDHKINIAVSRALTTK